MGNRRGGPCVRRLRGLDTIFLSAWQRQWRLLLENVYSQHPAQHQAHDTLSIDYLQIALFLLDLVIDKSTQRKAFSFLPVIYWFISFSQCGLMDSYLIQWIINCYYNGLFGAFIVLDLTNSSLFKLASVPTDMSPSFFKHYLTFWQDKAFWILKN